MAYTTEQIRQAQYELAARAARKDLLSFMRWCWWNPPVMPLKVGRHTDAICSRLTRAVADFRQGKSTYLLVAVPFRHGKSDIVSRALPAFFLGSCADLQPSCVLTGYGDTFVVDLTRQVQKIIADRPFRQLFPDVRVDPRKRSAESWGIEGSVGLVTVAGIHGAITGKTGNLIVVDDYCKSRADAESKFERDRVWNEFANSIMTRQSAPAAIVIVCATPWHVDDLRGRILQRMKDDDKFPRFEELNFPARNPGPDPKVNYDTLFPELYDENWYNSMEATLGEVDAQALLYCRPISKQGAWFKRDQFLTYDVSLLKGPNAKRWFSSMNRYIFVDTASAKKKDSDYSVMIVIGAAPDNKYYLLDAVKDHLSLSERGAAIAKLARKWNPRNVYWETIGAMADYEYIIEMQNKEPDLYPRFRITKLHQSVAKEDRIRWLEPVFANGELYFPSQLFYTDVRGVEHDLTYEFLEQEFVIYGGSGTTRHDDFIDDLANIKHPDVDIAFPVHKDFASASSHTAKSYSSSRAKSILFR